MLFVVEFFYVASSDCNGRQSELLGRIAQFTKFIEVVRQFFYCLWF